MAKKVEIRVSKDNSVKTEYFGYSGNECHTVANGIKTYVNSKLKVSEGEVVNKTQSQLENDGIKLSIEN